MLNGERYQFVSTSADEAEGAQDNSWMMGLAFAGVLAIVIRMLVAV